mgnify:FL=1
MFGIYLHIPFCEKACNYCDFHFSTSFKVKNQLIDCINQELENRKHELLGDVKTIYFGGGTPSILAKNEIVSVLNQIKKNYSIVDDVEITFECNPEDLSEKKLNELKESGVNRLSIGIQSFDNSVLKWMNRAHTADKAIACVDLAQKRGFKNISIDLIYGVPLFLNRNWKRDIEKAIQLNVQHISSYNLTKEKHTSLHNDVSKGKYLMPNQEVCSDQYQQLIENLAKSGFNQYEVSNFSLKGFESKHNSSYWSSIAYLGIGPSAHSYDGENIRRWNVSNNKKYIEGLVDNVDYFERETLAKFEMANEIILLGLRSDLGVSLKKIKSLLNDNQYQVFNNQVDLFKKKNLIKQTKNKLLVDSKSRILADYIARELFILPE